jgi:hypothetical protein
LNDVVRRIINCFYAPIANEAEPRWLVHQRQHESSICNRHAANYQSGGYESFHIGRPATCAVSGIHSLMLLRGRKTRIAALHAEWRKRCGAE